MNQATAGGAWGILLQVYAKEEELCELQVKLAEQDTALKAYKTENSRFADMKDKFKADIASLQQQVCFVLRNHFLLYGGFPS